MNSLDYIKLAQMPFAGEAQERLSVDLVTNFTDYTLKKIFQGVCNFHQLSAEIFSADYKQYAFELKNTNSGLRQRISKLTFFFFDANFFLQSEFLENPEFFTELLSDIKDFAQAKQGTVVLSAFLPPFDGPLNNLVKRQPVFELVESYNKQFQLLAEELPNVEFFDTNRIAHLLGNTTIRDMRGLYAFDIPFTNDFFTILSEQWSAYVRALCGKSKKIIVLDLDNTLWGGVVGELGKDGIDLGPVYPGSVFLNFQRALLNYHSAGILLAINSKNNLADVEEVLLQHPHMLLKKDHFSAIRANWQDKAQNLMEIAEELNIGLDSMIFLDDDPVNRALVKERLPEVFVADFSVPPENYASTLFSLPLFSPFSSTEEDKKRNSQYLAERARKEMKQQAGGLEGFIAGLNVKINVFVNNAAQVSRLAQLTQKTNQFNLTTKRYTEKEVLDFMEGGLVFSADINDKFGDYGITVLAIVKTNKNQAYLDTLLMSCRVMGRGVEFRFLGFVLNYLRENGIINVEAEFIPTAKNSPAAEILGQMGFVSQKEDLSGKKSFTLNLSNYKAEKNPLVNGLIEISKV